MDSANKNPIKVRDSTETIYNMIDSVRKIKNPEEREKMLIYFTGYADGVASNITKKE